MLYVYTHKFIAGGAIQRSLMSTFSREHCGVSAFNCNKWREKSCMRLVIALNLMPPERPNNMCFVEF